MMETYNDIYVPITAEEMANIPEEMKKEPRWICWGSDKVPVSISSAQNGNHYGIDVTKPENWGTFTQAAAAIGQPAYVKYLDQNFHIVGIGFVVGDGWFCADLDGGAGHKKEDVPEDPITSAVIKMHTYFEKSLSGCGYHIFGKCDFDSAKAESNKPHRNQDGNPVPESYEIEFFTRRKFIAITGRIVETKKYCSNKHINTGFDGIFGARSFYEEWILNDFQRDEEKRAEERAKVARNITINTDDAAQMFLLNYPEILAASDSSNFKRGGPGVKLAPGEYSWIAAVKAMQEIGIPEADIIDWCRRGNNFKSEKDVQKVLDKPGKPGAASVAGIITDAKANGWKPDPAKLTGEAKRNHEQKLYEEEQLRKFREEHREEHAAALAAVGIDCAGDPYRYTWTLDFDGSLDEVIDKNTGEIVYKKPAAPEHLETGETVNLANPAAAAPAETDSDNGSDLSKKVDSNISSFVSVISKHYPIRFNELNQRAEIFRDGHWNDYSDTDEAIITQYCQDVYNISNRANLHDAVLICQRQNIINPLTDILCSLVWDGKPRTRSFLHNIMKCDDNQVTREISQMIFTGGIRRAFEPGCKWDNVPIFVGKQGSGKSTIVGLLGLGFSGLIRTFSGKEAIEGIGGLWIGEIAELAAIRRAKDLEEIKAFVTTQVDKYRKPYGHIDSLIPRRCIFIGTTNSNAFLTDQTGNRRFFPIAVHSDAKEIWKHIDETNEYIRQAWAEAFAQYKDGTLPSDYDHGIDSKLNEIREGYQADDWILNEIDGILSEFKEGDKVCVRLLWSRVGMEKEKLTRNESTIIGTYLDNHPEWERCKNKPRFNGFGQQRGWVKKAVPAEVQIVTPFE